MTTTLRSFHDRYLCAEPDGRVVADRTDARAWEQWTVQPHLDGVSLQSAHGGYLCAEPDGRVVADRAARGPWEVWTPIPHRGGVAYRSAHARYLCAEADGAVIANREHAAEWETWGGAGVSPGPTGPLSPLRVEGNRRWLANAAGRFDWRETSAFSLLSRLLVGEHAYVRGWLQDQRARGFTGARVICTLDGAYWVHTPHGRSFRCAPDMHGYWERLRDLCQIAGEVGIYLRLCLVGAVEPFGGTWYPDRRDVWSGDVRARGEAFVLEAAERVKDQAGVILEIANEPGQIGLRHSIDALHQLGWRVKAIAPNRLLNGGALDGGAADDPAFCRAPFDFVDTHLDRRTQYGGFEWVKRSGDSPVIDGDKQPTPMPFMSGEPINFGGRRADNGAVEEPSRSVPFGYGATSRVRQYNTNFHWDGGLWTTAPDAATADAMAAYHAGLDAIPMLTGQLWRGTWSPAQGNYWRTDLYPGEGVDVDRHIESGHGPYRIFGTHQYAVTIAEPQRWDWASKLTRGGVERVAYNAVGTYASGVYRS